jgi:hypothetical protein
VSTVETPVKKTSRWEDYIDVIFSPGELYARRANDKVAPAFWTLLVLAAILYYAFLPSNELIMRAGMEQARARMAEQGQDPAAMDGWVNAMKYLGGIMAAITYALAVFTAAFFLWIVARLVEVKAVFHQALVVAVYAGFIYLLANLVGSVLAMLIGEGLDPVRDLSLGLNRFFDAESLPAVIPALFRRTEVFFIWQAVVWAIGVRVVMKATRAQAAITAFAAWLLFALPGMIGALLGFGQNAG